VLKSEINFLDDESDADEQGDEFAAFQALEMALHAAIFQQPGACDALLVLNAMAAVVATWLNSAPSAAEGRAAMRFFQDALHANLDHYQQGQPHHPHDA
jgi:hypothetical protein